MARCRESGTAAAGWLLSCACQGLTLPGLPGTAYLAWPCNNGRGGRAGLRLCCAPCSNKVSGMALSDLFRLLSQWHWCWQLSGAEMLLEYCRPAAGRDRPSGCCPHGDCRNPVLLPWWLPCEDCRYGDCRPGAGLLFCFHHLHLQEDAISLQLCLSG